MQSEASTTVFGYDRNTRNVPHQPGTLAGVNLPIVEFWHRWGEEGG